MWEVCLGVQTTTVTFYLQHFTLATSWSNDVINLKFSGDNSWIASLTLSNFMSDSARYIRAKYLERKKKFSVSLFWKIKCLDFKNKNYKLFRLLRRLISAKSTTFRRVKFNSAKTEKFAKISQQTSFNTHHIRHCNIQ